MLRVLRSSCWRCLAAWLWQTHRAICRTPHSGSTPNRAQVIDERPYLLTHFPVTVFRDPLQYRLAACAVFSRHQPTPGRKVAAIRKLAAIAHLTDQRSTGDRPQTGHAEQLCIALLTGAECRQLALYFTNLFVQRHQGVIQALQQPAGDGR